MSDGRTTADARQAALPAEQAFAYLAGEDERPLLVLRECLRCNEASKALLGASADNEKAILLTRWFNCVKLPVDAVLEESHPFHNLFPAKEGKKPPHLFVADFDGANVVPLKAERSRTELWELLNDAVKRNYKKDSRKSLKSLAKMLDRYDVVDRQLDELTQQFENTIETKGPKSKKLAKIQKSIDKKKAELEKLNKDFAKASELQLIEKEKPAVAAKG